MSEEAVMQRPVATVRFQPQAWANNYAVIDVDPEGETTFEVDAQELHELLNRYDEWSRAYSHEPFQHLPQLPQWIRKWRGPFYYDVEWPQEEVDMLDERDRKDDA